MSAAPTAARLISSGSAAATDGWTVRRPWRMHDSIRMRAAGAIGTCLVNATFAEFLAGEFP